MNGAMATTVGRQHRASSTALSVSDKLLPPSLSPFPPPLSAAPPPPSALTPGQVLPSQQQQQLPISHSSAERAPPPSSTGPPSVHPSFLQPRVAVVLNVPPTWHPWLFALRLASILPAVCWGLPSALQLLLLLLPGSDTVLPSGQQPPPFALCSTARSSQADDAVHYALAEAALATIWCFACGYLSFTDCLMYRWLINYTPQATIVRLLTINAVNAYVTLSVLSLTGGFDDARLLLLGWIGIATTLTVCYHITHQTINIRKETSTSINVFYIASYITMITLLVHMHSCVADYPTMPITTRGQRLWSDAVGLMAQIKKAVDHAEL